MGQSLSKYLNAKKYIFIIIGIVTLFIIGYYYDSYIDRKILHKASKLMSKGEFAIGEIEGKGYDNTKGVSRLSSILYYFTSNQNKQVSGNLMSYEVRALSIKNERIWKDNFYWTEKGDKYLVLFEKNNPKNALLLLDMPIKDSLDLKKYVKEIEKIRQQK